MSSPPSLFLAPHLGDDAPTAVQMDVLLQVLITAASHCCECQPYVAIAICLEL